MTTRTEHIRARGRSSDGGPSSQVSIFTGTSHTYIQRFSPPASSSRFAPTVQVVVTSLLSARAHELGAHVECGRTASDSAALLAAFVRSRGEMHWQIFRQPAPDVQFCVNHLKKFVYLFSRTRWSLMEPRVPAHSGQCGECAGMRGSGGRWTDREKRYTNTGRAADVTE